MGMEHTANPIARAIAIVGSQCAMASAVGTTQQNVSRMMRNGRASPKFAPRIERATGGQITRHELCPDVDWGDDKSHSRHGAAA